MLSKIPASSKLYLLIFVMSFFILAIGIYGIMEIKTMHRNMQTIYQDRLLPLQQLTTIRYSYSVLVISTAEQVQTNQSSFDEAAQQIAAAEKNIDTNWKMYLQTYLTPEEKQLAEQASSLMTVSAQSIRQMEQVIKSADRAALDSFIDRQLYPALNPVLAKITALIDLQIRVGSQVYKNNTAVYRAALQKSVGLMLVCLCFAIPFSYFLVRNIRQLIDDLQESEKKYRNIFENVQDVFYQTSLSGVVLEVSPSIENHTGISREALLGTSVLDIYYEPLEWKTSIERLKEKGILTDYEFRLKSNNGDPIFVSLNARLIAGAGGHPDHIDGMFRNITESKKAQVRIQQSESNYRQLFESSPAAMWLCDETTSQFIQVNQSFRLLYGYSAEELTRITMQDIIPGFRERGLASFKGSQRHIKKSGDIMEVECTGIPVVLNGKKQILVVVIDVTEKNRYEQKLTRAAIKVQEEERYEIGGELHDNVCQILASSLLYLDMAKKDMPPAALKNLDLTHRYITLANHEIRNLSHRLAPVFFDETSLEGAFENLLHSFNVQGKYQIMLQVDDVVRTRPFSRELQLALYRILQEQLRNISRHARALHIQVILYADSDTMHLQIIDNGVGFDTTTNKGGIGLANMERRVQLFGGRISVDSSPGKGCIVTVVIPLTT